MNIGILGGGQLGRMLALAAYPLGVQVRAIDPAPDAPIALLSRLMTGDYADLPMLDRFATGLSVITYEFENVPVDAARYLEQLCPVYPPPLALEKAQDRWVEKSFLRSLGIPTPQFLAVEGRAELVAAIAQMGVPAVLKTRRMGYDGKGQVVIRSLAEVESAWAMLQQGGPLILEGFVPFQRELSLLAVRSTTGEIRFYPLVENQHEGGILRFSRAPAPDLTPQLQATAEGYARSLLEALNYVGVLAIELFQVGDQLLANEIAPRVHNSGHWSIEGAVTSQFANHIRAIMGLPLGDCSPIGHSVMINLIGSLPDRSEILRVANASLHFYGKAPRPGRKVGHITIHAQDAKEVERSVAEVQNRNKL